MDPITSMDSKTSIAVSRTIRDQLSLLGDKDSTFNDIIQKLIKKWNDEN